MKYCSRFKKGECLSEINPQSMDSFCIDKRATDGLSSQCKSCYKKWRINNKEYFQRRQQRRYSANREMILKKSSIRYQEKKDQILERNKSYRERSKIIRSVYNKKWARENKAYCASYFARRRAIKLKATPKWLNKDHYKQIQEFYKIARELKWLSQERLEVDHIIPLQGKNVSGLHVPWNFQIIPKSENLKKGIRINQ